MAVRRSNYIPFFEDMMDVLKLSIMLRMRKGITTKYPHGEPQPLTPYKEVNEFQLYGKIYTCSIEIQEVKK